MTNEPSTAALPELLEFQLEYEDGWKEVWLARAGATGLSLVATAKQMLDIAGASYDIKWPISEPDPPAADEKPAAAAAVSEPKSSRARGQTSRKPSERNRRRAPKASESEPAATPPADTGVETTVSSSEEAS